MPIWFLDLIKRTNLTWRESFSPFRNNKNYKTMNNSSLLLPLHFWSQQWLNISTLESFLIVDGTARVTLAWFICVLVRMSQCVRVRVGPAGKWHGNKLPPRATEEERGTDMWFPSAVRTWRIWKGKTYKNTWAPHELEQGHKHTQTQMCIALYTIHKPCTLSVQTNTAVNAFFTSGAVCVWQ